jgi:hypothetical protein
VKKFLDRYDFQVLSHPPCSPDLSPCDFFLFGEMKKWLQGKQFRNARDVPAQVETFLDSIDPQELRDCFEAWPRRCERVIRSKGAFLF